MAFVVPEDLTPELALVVASLIAIAGYNALELYFWIFDFFKQRRGIYFGAMMAGTTGTLVYTTALTLYLFLLAPKVVYSIGIGVGYFAMVTGNIMVLYSRLHLVTNGRVVRIVLIFIILSTLALQVPLEIISFVAAFANPNLLPLSRLYEKIVVTGSCLREFIVAGIYIYEAVRNLKPVMAVKGREGRKVIRILIVVNFIVIVLDSTLLVSEYTRYRAIKMSYSAITNSVKIKMEFAILNKLIGLIQNAPNLAHLQTLPLASSEYDSAPGSGSGAAESGTPGGSGGLASRRGYLEKQRGDDSGAGAGAGASANVSELVERRRWGACHLDGYHEMLCNDAVAETEVKVPSPPRVLSWSDLVPTTRGESVFVESSGGSKGPVVSEVQCRD